MGLSHHDLDRIRDHVRRMLGRLRKAASATGKNLRLVVPDKSIRLVDPNKPKEDGGLDE